MKIKHNSDYREKRKNEYPSIEEQLDAIWKGGTEMEKMKNLIISIKNKYRKEK